MARLNPHNAWARRELRKKTAHARRVGVNAVCRTVVGCLKGPLERLQGASSPGDAADRLASVVKAAAGLLASATWELERDAKKRSRR